MNLNNIPFGTTNWSGVEPTEHPGERGKAFWRVRQFGDIRESKSSRTTFNGMCTTKNPVQDLIICGL